jgi:hypothetical protein
VGSFSPRKELEREIEKFPSTSKFPSTVDPRMNGLLGEWVVR